MKLRILNALLYFALTVIALSTIAAPLRAALGALVSRYSYAPDLRAPALWIGLAAVLLALVADIGRRLASGRRAGLPRYAALLVLTAAAIGAVKALPPPARVPVSEALGHLLARTELAADRAFAQDHRYPVDPAVLAADFPDFVRAQGFHARGARSLESRLHVVEGAFEPVFRAGDEIRPGDLVFAVDSSRTRYWLTAFTLDRKGAVVPYSDGRGRILVATGADGRPASRLDPLFPEYPTKSVPLPREGMPGAHP